MVLQIFPKQKYLLANISSTKISLHEKIFPQGKTTNGSLIKDYHDGLEQELKKLFQPFFFCFDLGIMGKAKIRSNIQDRAFCGNSQHIWGCSINASR